MLRRSLIARLVACGALVATTASGDVGAGSAPTLSMRLDGVDAGHVRGAASGTGSGRVLTITTAEPRDAVLGYVRAFFDGRGAKASTIVLATDAVIQTTKAARLVEVRFPSFAGGSTDLTLLFAAPATSTSPSLRVANDRARPAGKKLSGFRLTAGDLPTREATRLEALVLKAKDGALLPGTMSFDVPSKDAPSFVAWSKKPRAVDVDVDYIGPLGELVFPVRLAGCSAASATIDGPVTHVVLACAKPRAR